LAPLLLLTACNRAEPAVSLEPATETSTPPAAVAPLDASSTADASTPAETGASWVVVAHQRRDVLEISSEQVLALLRGDIEDWSDLGGAPGPLNLLVPTEDADAIARGTGLASIAGEHVEAAEVAERVASEIDAIGLARPEALRPGLLALVIEGHDPYRDPSWASPLRLAGGEPPPFNPTLLVATGEIIPARCTNAALARLDDYDAMFEDVGTLLGGGEVTLTALEVPLSDVGAPTPCVETFNMLGSPRAVDAIALSGIDVVAMVGNHMLDCWGGCSGRAAMLDTVERFHAAGIETAGAGADLEAAHAPAFVTPAGDSGEALTFAFLAYDTIQPTYHATKSAAGIAGYDAASMRADIEAARRTADVVVVSMNWGVEYTPNPTAFQIEAAHAALDAGANLVVGNHPHWVQALQAMPDGDGLVAYALGNLVFDQDWSRETTESAILEVSFLEARIVGYRLRPIVLRELEGAPAGLYRPEPVDPAGEGRPILERIWSASDALEARTTAP